VSDQTGSIYEPSGLQVALSKPFTSSLAQFTLNLAIFILGLSGAFASAAKGALTCVSTNLYFGVSCPATAMVQLRSSVSIILFTSLILLWFNFGFRRTTQVFMLGTVLSGFWVASPLFF